MGSVRCDSPLAAHSTGPHEGASEPSLRRTTAAPALSERWYRCVHPPLASLSAFHTAVLDYHHGHIRFSGCLLVDTGWCAILLPVLRIVRDPQLRIETVLQLAKAPNGLHALHVL